MSQYRRHIPKGSVCFWCEKRLHAGNCSREHVTPKMFGGGGDVKLACRSCNNTRGTAYSYVLSCARVVPPMTDAQMARHAKKKNVLWLVELVEAWKKRETNKLGFTFLSRLDMTGYETVKAKISPHNPGCPAHEIAFSSR